MAETKLDMSPTTAVKETSPTGGKSLHEAAWPDMFANLQAAYAELTHTQSEVERRASQIDEIRDLFEQIIESMSDALFLTDAAGRVGRVNRAACEMLRRDEDDVVGLRLSEVCQNDSIPATPALVLAASSSGSITGLEAEIATADGGNVPVGISSALVRDKRGKITGVVVIARDITEQRKVQQAERELAQMKEDFVASVSHELRTPLASIKGFVDLMLKGRAQTEEVRQEFLGRVVFEADRLLGLVNDLLDISRLEAGRFQLDVISFHLDDLIEETLQSLHGVADQKKIPLQFTRGSGDFSLQGDRRRLQQVLINLVGNAVKFSDEGRPVAISAALQGHHALIRVRDQGPGIPADSLPKLFDKFYQTSDAGKRAATGTGLGLYISKQIIEAHGGQVEVTSEVGVGSTFDLIMPLVIELQDDEALAAER